MSILALLSVLFLAGLALCVLMGRVIAVGEGKLVAATPAADDSSASAARRPDPG